MLVARWGGDGTGPSLPPQWVGHGPLYIFKCRPLLFQNVHLNFFFVQNFSNFFLMFKHYNIFIFIFTNNKNTINFKITQITNREFIFLAIRTIKFVTKSTSKWNTSIVEIEWSFFGSNSQSWSYELTYLAITCGR